MQDALGSDRKKPSTSALGGPGRVPRGGQASAEAYRVEKYVLGR